MAKRHSSRRSRGGFKAGILLWLLGAPLLVIVLGYAIC